MNSPKLYWQNILFRLRKLYGQQNETRRHYATLPGSMASYGERTQTSTIKNHANLLAYLANWLLYTPVNGFQETPRRPFPRVCSSLFSAHFSRKTLPEQAPTTTRLRVLTIMQLRAWASWQSASAQLSPLYLLSTLYVTHVINYSRPSTAFPYCKCKAWERG